MRHLPLAAEHGRHDRWKDTAVTLCACMDNCGVGPYTQLSIHLYRAANENSMEASCFQKKGTEQTTKRGHKCKGSPCTRGWLFLLPPPCGASSMGRKDAGGGLDEHSAGLGGWGS